MTTEPVFAALYKNYAFSCYLNWVLLYYVGLAIDVVRGFRPYRGK